MSRAMDIPMIAEVTRAGVRHGVAGTFELAPEVRKLAAEQYTSPEIFKSEVSRVFGRLPQLLAPSVPTINLYVRNLLDRRGASTTTVVPNLFESVTPREPRSFGIQVGVKF